MLTISDIYRILLDKYGPQGWWPLLPAGAGAGSRPVYHPGDYNLPAGAAQRFEIAVGAVLTQNTAWKNVETALANLAVLDALSPAAILAMPPARCANAIRPAGYFNMKARKLRELAAFWQTAGDRAPNRDRLLGVWGIGPETADSILLYAFARPVFVIDAYTRRILEKCGLIQAGMAYEELRRYCENSLPRRAAVYQEMHALLVTHAKHHYQKKPYADPLLSEV